MLAVRELPARPNKATPLLSGLRLVVRNRPFVILLAAYTISAIGNNLPATLILFYVEYVLQSDLADFFSADVFSSPASSFYRAGSALPAGPARRRPGSHQWRSIPVPLSVFFFLGPGDILIYGILVMLSGIGFGATLAISLGDPGRRD